MRQGASPSRPVCDYCIGENGGEQTAASHVIFLSYQVV